MVLVTNDVKIETSTEFKSIHFYLEHYANDVFVTTDGRVNRYVFYDNVVADFDTKENRLTLYGYYVNYDKTTNYYWNFNDRHKRYFKKFINKYTALKYTSEQKFKELLNMEGIETNEEI